LRAKRAQSKATWVMARQRREEEGRDAHGHEHDPYHADAHVAPVHAIVAADRGVRGQERCAALKGVARKNPKDGHGNAWLQRAPASGQAV